MKQIPEELREESSDLFQIQSQDIETSVVHANH
jgi:hypothetical protein